MEEIKSRLQGGVQQKKKLGSERIKAVLSEIKRKGVVTESELAAATNLDKAVISKYVEFLSENGLVNVKKRLFRDAEISVAGGRGVVVEAKREQPPRPKQEKKAGAEQAPQAETPENQGEAVAENPPETSASNEGDNKAPQPAPEDQGETPAPQTTVHAEKEKTPEPQPPTPNGEKPGTEEPAAPASAAPQQAMAVSGSKLMPETEEELKEVAKSLVTDFIGIMRLSGEVSGQSYTTALLIDKGDLVAVSFEHMDTVEVIGGDAAFREIQSKFMGTKGDLEIFEMSEEDLNESLRLNIDYVITTPLKLSALNIKIKSRQKPPEEQKPSIISGLKGLLQTSDAADKQERKEMLREVQKRKVEKISGGLTLIDFARNLKLDSMKAKRFEELRKTRQPQIILSDGSQDPRKAERIEQLKMQQQKAASVFGALNIGVSKGDRQEQIKQMRASPQITLPKEEKKLVNAVQEGRKIATTIDKFYELVETQKKVKLNDALAAKLKVTKTQIEEWAMILEEHSLLELKYPTIGEPEIILVEGNKAQKKEDGDGRKKT